MCCRLFISCPVCGCLPNTMNWQKCLIFSVTRFQDPKISPPQAPHSGSSRQDEKRRGIIAGIAALCIAAAAISSSVVYLWWKWVSLVKRSMAWEIQEFWCRYLIFILFPFHASEPCVFVLYVCWVLVVSILEGYNCCTVHIVMKA